MPRLRLAVRTAAPDKIYVVEALRGAAALSVAWFHLTSTYSPGFVRSLGSLGWAGVDVFFVVSGFIIPYSLAKASYAPSDFPRFFLRRLIRLEPPYIMSIALVIGLWYASALVPQFRCRPPTVDLLQVATHFLYLIPFSHFDWLQPVYWTLAYEFAFYLIVGLAFPLISADRSDVVWIFICTIVVSLVALGALSNLAILFAIGISTYRGISLRGIRSLTNIIIAFVTAIFMMQYNMVGSIVGMIASISIYSLHSWRSSGHLYMVAAWLGSISYSLYLVHVPIGGRVVNLGNRLIDGQLQQFALSVVAMAVSLFAAALFHRFVEVRAMRWAKGVGAPTTGHLARSGGPG